MTQQPHSWVSSREIKTYAYAITWTQVFIAEAIINLNILQGLNRKTNCSLLLLFCCCVIAKSCPILLQPHGSYPPVSSLYVISKARILKWVAISFFRGSPQHRDQIRISSLAGRFFTTESPGLFVHVIEYYSIKKKKELLKYARLWMYLKSLYQVKEVNFKRCDSIIMTF